MVAMRRISTLRFATNQFRRFLNVSSRDGDIFTHHGILPFLQYRINTMFSKEHINVSPTQAQMEMFAVLKQDKTLVLKDNITSGKSFALLLHVINKELKEKRNMVRSNNPLLSTKLISSCIVVPNNTLLLKYKEWAQNLIQGLESECCEITLCDGDEVRTLKTPLNIQIIDRKGNWSMLSTDKESNKKNLNPQIVITSVPQFYQIMLGQTSDYLPNKSEFIDCKFFAVDEANFVFNSSLSSDIYPNVHKATKKGKYQYVWFKSMKILRNLQIEAFSARNEETKIEKLNPLQYCFLFHAQHPFKRVYDHLMSRDTDLVFNPSNSNDYSYLETKLDELNDYDTELIKDLVKNTFDELQFYKRQPSIVKLESFLNSQFYRSLPNGNIHKKLNLCISALNSTSSDDKFVAFDVKSNQPERSNFFRSFLLKASVNFTNSFKKYLKAKSKEEQSVLQRPNSKFCSSQDIKESIKYFQKKFPDKGPVLVVVPSHSSLSYHAKKINSSRALGNDKVIAYKDFHNISSLKYPALSSTDDKENIESPGKAIEDFFKNQNEGGDHHLLFPSSEIPGATFNGVKNIIIFEHALLPTLSTAKYDPQVFETFHTGILGIKSPFIDLFYYYILLLQMDQDDNDRNILLIRDERFRKSKGTFEQSRTLLSDMILYNDINMTVNHEDMLQLVTETLQYDHTNAQIQ